METLPLRLPPDTDLRAALEQAVTSRSCRAAFILSGIGSLSQTRLRRAGVTEIDSISGDVEILTLAGTISANGAHLHMSIADAAGTVIGGHVAKGCIIRTTAEVLLVLLPDWSFSREADPATGFAELVVRHTSHKDN